MFRRCQSLRPTVVWSPSSLASGASSVDISPWDCGGEAGVGGWGGVCRAQSDGTTRDEWCISSHGPGTSPRVSSMLPGKSSGLGFVLRPRSNWGELSNGGVRPEILQSPSSSAPRLLRRRGAELPLNGPKCSLSSTTTLCPCCPNRNLDPETRMSSAWRLLEKEADGRDSSPQSIFHTSQRLQLSQGGGRKLFSFSPSSDVQGGGRGRSAGKCSLCHARATPNRAWASSSPPSSQHPPISKASWPFL